jgi:hypothetical protein
VDVVRMADDKGKLMSQQACFLIRHEASFSGPHTGPVWVVADPSATGNITLSFVAVTK